MDSSGKVRKLKRNELPLFRGESPRYAFVFCASMSPSLLGRREAFRPGTEDVDFDFIAVLHGNAMPVTTQDDDLVETPPP